MLGGWLPGEELAHTQRVRAVSGLEPLGLTMTFAMERGRRGGGSCSFGTNLTAPVLPDLQNPASNTTSPWSPVWLDGRG